MSSHTPELPGLPSYPWILTLIVGAFIVTFAMYGPSLNNNFVAWNDPSVIYNNGIVSAITPETLKMAFTRFDPELYIPLTFLSYQVDFEIAGLHPFIYHLDNLLWHTVNVLLVAWFVYLLCGEYWVVLFCGILFAVHPLNTEAVVWASSRKDLLSTAFFLISLIAYLYFRDRRTTILLVLSVFAFVLGLLSKVTVLTLPAILLLIDARSPHAWTWKSLRDKIPYAACALIFGIIGFFGKENAIHATTLQEKILIPFKSIEFYLQKLLVPTQLSAIYPYTSDVHLFSQDIFFPLLVVIVLLAMIVVLWSRARSLSFGLLFFLITLAPTLLNFYKTQEIVFAADHYAYLPSVGFFYCLGSAVYSFCAKSRQHSRDLGICTIVIAIIACTFGYLTSVQALMWHDSEQLFKNVLNYYPNAFVAQLNLADVYVKAHKLDDAMVLAKDLLLKEPRGRVHRLLGDIYLEEQNYSEAEREYKQAIENEPQNPVHYAELGYAYQQHGEVQQAIDAYYHALDIDPSYADVHTNLSVLYFAQKRFAEARSEAEVMVTLRPQSAKAHYILGLSLEKLQQLDAAFREYKISVDLDANADNIDAITSLATLYLYRGDHQESLALLKRGFELDPNSETVQILAREMINAGIMQAPR